MVYNILNEYKVPKKQKDLFILVKTIFFLKIWLRTLITFLEGNDHIYKYINPVNFSLQLMLFLTHVRNNSML